MSYPIKVWTGSQWEEIGLSGGALSITPPPNISTSGSVGSSSVLARSDHTHGFDANALGVLQSVAASAYVQKSLVNAKGDLITATANDTPAILAAGSNGQMLMADSSATAGLRYVDPPANRNRLINGGMILDQRNAGASLTPTAGGQYCLDRWANNISAGSKYSVQRSTTAPAGFTNSMLITSLAATTPAAGDIYEVYNVIEGYDVRDLGFGAAGASTITLSFWVRSSLTGTFCGRIGNTGTAATPNRTWVFEYSVAVADTWERKTVTISGDTAGTWNKTDGAGLRVGFTLGAGTNFDATAGAWNSPNRAMTTSGIDLVATNGATLYLTGVQLEASPVATPFEFEPYEATLRKCQRYYQRITPGAAGRYFAHGQSYSTTQTEVVIPYKTVMRTNPTALEQNGTAADYRVGTAAGSSTALSAVPSFVHASDNAITILATVASGQVAGNATPVMAWTATAYLGWSAEL